MKSSLAMWFLLGLILLSACEAGEKRSVPSSGAESTLVIAAIETRPWNHPVPLPQGRPIADTQARVTDKDSLSIAMPPVQLSPSPEGDSVTAVSYTHLTLPTIYSV